MLLESKAVLPRREVCSYNQLHFRSPASCPSDPTPLVPVPFGLINTLELAWVSALGKSQGNRSSSPWLLMQFTVPFIVLLPSRLCCLLLHSCQSLNHWSGWSHCCPLLFVFLIWSSVSLSREVRPGGRAQDYSACLAPRKAAAHCAAQFQSSPAPACNRAT